MARLGAGDLVERVAFDAPLNLPDGYGGEETGWTDGADAVTARAHYRYLRGGEAVQAARLEGRQPVVATVRATAETRAITTDWRMRDTATGAVFNIRSGPVLSDDRMWVEFTCESGVAV